jgi:thioredoxin 1
MHLRSAALLLAVAALSAAPAAAAGPAARQAVPSHGTQAKAPLPRLVFFMNPYGRPCQVQDEILRGMGAELTERAELVYYKTSERADLARFQEYGIRALPMLVVTDAAGRELRRATPGILAMPQILKLLQP